MIQPRSAAIASDCTVEKNGPIGLVGVWNAGSAGSTVMCDTTATVIPGASSGTKPMRRPGEELILVIDGVLEFEVAEVTHRLGPGDAMHFRTSSRTAGAIPGRRMR